MCVCAAPLHLYFFSLLMWVSACPSAAPPCVPACLFHWMVLVFVSLEFTSNRHLYERDRGVRDSTVDYRFYRCSGCRPIFFAHFQEDLLEEDADHNGLRNIITFFLVSVHRPLCSPPLPPPKLSLIFLILPF